MYKNSNNSIKKTKIIANNTALQMPLNLTLKGGRVLGKGTYGCVVYPAIPCNKTINQSHINNLPTNNSKQENKYVSKLIRNPSTSGNEEIEISKIIKTIDPQQKYFITFNNFCYLKNIPEHRTDSVSGKFLDKKLKNFRKTISHKQLDKTYCPIDLSLKPINLVMKYGGYDLYDVINSASKDKHLLMSKILLQKQFKSCFKNLIYGVYKMHDSRIVNRDIKLENIMLNYNINTHSIDMKFIDFGMSNYLSKKYCALQNNGDVFSNIGLVGTIEYVPPEIFVLVYILDYQDRKPELVYKLIQQDVAKDIGKSLLFLKEYSMLKNLSTIVHKLFVNIYKDIANPKLILENFWGSTTNKFDGYVQKTDIYALGIAIYNFLEHYRIRNIHNKNNKNNINVKTNAKLYDLIKHMIELEPDKRYNILDCLKHTYFDE